ncbi:hypothetical protein L3C95_31820 [Chitinophaga filiformis]|uniref:tetratricopeptide repeat protein n=1 Tax=Chitinophaga filiformis TaxID=104663 RepID=UPI001F3A4210|nr:hypothetical protein [Chitinophaga filiformis]MCF6407523.1 hypothetical protein [Chitinophaga filiformis]
MQKTITVTLVILLPILCKAQTGTISIDSLNRFFNKLTEPERYKKENINFMIMNNISSKSLFFDFLKKKEYKIQEATGKNQYIQSHIDYIIAKEEIDPLLWKNSDSADSSMAQPNWELMRNKITKKFSRDYADRTILGAQVRWYGYKKDTINLIKCTVEKNDKYGLDTAGFGKAALNNMIYSLIFTNSNDPDILNKAIKWMGILVTSEPNNASFIDTYANILYKAGRDKEALNWQKRAIILAPDNNEIRETLIKMERGEPTWPVKKRL